MKNKFICLLFALSVAFSSCTKISNPIVPSTPADLSGEPEITGTLLEPGYYFPFSNQYNCIAMIVDLGSDEESADSTIDHMIDKYYPPSVKADTMRSELKAAERVCVGENAYYLFLPRYTDTTFTVNQTKGKTQKEIIGIFSSPFILIADRKNVSVCVNVSHGEITDTIYPTAFTENDRMISETNHIYDFTSDCKSDDVLITDPDFSEQLILIASGKIHFDFENKATDNPENIWNAILCAASFNVASGYYTEEGNIALYADELSLYSEVLYGLSIDALPAMPDSVACNYDTANDAYIFAPFVTENISYEFSQQMVTESGCILFIAQMQGEKEIKRFRTDWEYADNGLGMKLSSISETE